MFDGFRVLSSVLPPGFSAPSLTSPLVLGCKLGQIGGNWGKLGLRDLTRKLVVARWMTQNLCLHLSHSDQYVALLRVFSRLHPTILPAPSVRPFNI